MWRLSIIFSDTQEVTGSPLDPAGDVGNQVSSATGEVDKGGKVRFMVRVWEGGRVSW